MTAKTLIVLTAALGGLAGCASGPPTAAFADRYGMGASTREREQPIGYSDGARHVADCLAAHPSYDPSTNQYRTRNGRTRSCAR